MEKQKENSRKKEEKAKQENHRILWFLAKSFVVILAGASAYTVFKYFEKFSPEISRNAYWCISAAPSIPVLAFLIWIISKQGRNFITPFIILLGFQAGLLGIVDYTLSSQTKTLIPHLPEGTVGFRTWGSKALVYEIRITYLKEDGITWARVPQNMIAKENFLKAWEEGPREAKQRWLAVNKPGEDFFKGQWEEKLGEDDQRNWFRSSMEWHSSAANLEGSIRGMIDDSQYPAIELQNCGAYFADNKVRDLSKYVRIDAKVIFRQLYGEEATEKYNKKNGTSYTAPHGVNSAQICFRVPRLEESELEDIKVKSRPAEKDDHTPYTTLKNDQKTIIHTPILYIAFELTANETNFSKVWVPALDFQPAVTHKDPEFKLRKAGFPEKLERNNPYHFAAWLYQDTARLQGIAKDGTTVTLYEGKIAEPKEAQPEKSSFFSFK